MNLPAIQPRPTILPAKPPDRIANRKAADERRRRRPEEHEKERNKDEDDGCPHVDEYC